ncbi:hypothetical protein [Methylophaga sp.]|uniref:hypothetical protein n=1 Tax=Methylophaga sp. TaxID=2024840 RepID=UPI00271AA27E|nr:hypothetical protein [Methylophaga sp.]MDO8828245.1 hypothetical protein [Methylophaga sp.]
MKAPFSVIDLDNLLHACIEFTQHHEPLFYTGNICGRNGVATDADVVQNMFSWIAETDKDLLEDCGFGKDDIHYFRLGHGAIEIMKRGGFKTYLSSRSWTERLEKVRLWAPIAISIIAIAVSLFALNKPTVTANKVDDLHSQWVELHKEQEQLKAVVERLSKAQEQLSKQATPVAPVSNEPVPERPLQPITPAER